MDSLDALYSLSLCINGQAYQLDIPANRTLVDLLRYDLGFTGTKEACSVGVCGACTVLIDGVNHYGCSMLTHQVRGRAVTTIEGLAEEGLHPVQQAFKSHFAIQCGYCTPGMVLSSYALLQKNPEPDEGEIRQALVGNLCMCTGYQQIVDAVSHAADRARRIRDED